MADDLRTGSVILESPRRYHPELVLPANLSLSLRGDRDGDHCLRTRLLVLLLLLFNTCSRVQALSPRSQSGRDLTSGTQIGGIKKKRGNIYNGH